MTLVTALFLVGCSDDDGGGSTNTDTDTGTVEQDTATTDTGSTPEDTGSPADTAMDDTGTPMETGGETGGDTGGDTGGMAPTFTQVWSSTLEGKCRSCHDSTGPAGNLNMANKGNAYNNLVGKPAAGAACNGMGTRVVAGNAAMSILYTKVTTPTCGARMPAGGAPALSMTETNRIRDWINAGALNN